MLTEAEKKWLEEREVPLDAEDYDEDYHDAAEFEVRVAAKIAHEPCPCFLPPLEKCAKIKGETMEDVTRCRLKHARLAVEQEMDAEGK